MRFLASLVMLGTCATTGIAQQIPAHLMGAYGVGQAAHYIARADPCFPRDRRAADELAGMLAEAQRRIGADPDMQQAYETARRHSEWQQRYIGRSDPVACGQAADALRFFLAR